MADVEAKRARGIDRALALLDCLHQARQPLAIGELARRLRAPRSTTYEIVERLIRAGLLAEYPEGTVFFGRTVHLYASDYLAVNDFSRHAKAAVQDLAERTGHSAQYCVVAGNKYVVEHMHSGSAVFRISANIGLSVPIPWTATGRLLLGGMSRAGIEALIPQDDLILPSGRRIELDAFCGEIQEARAAGFCITTGLVDDFSQCMAAPVHNRDRDVLGCLCLVVPAATPGQDGLVEALRSGAARLERHAGSMPAPFRERGCSPG